MRWLWGVLFTVQAFAVEVPIDTTFPLENYPQDLSLYLSPKDQDYTLPLIDKKQQTKNLEQFYRHYYGIYSPWSESMVNAVLPFVQSKEEAMLAEFSNQGKAESQLHFAFNFALQE
jgi:hypothetical protein